MLIFNERHLSKILTEYADHSASAGLRRDADLRFDVLTFCR
jgi:hypothetical protein